MVDVALYPNPVGRNTLTVTSKNKLCWFQLMNMAGEKIAEAALSANEHEHRIDLPESLQGGIYFAGFTTVDSKIVFRKVIVIRN